MPLAGEFFEVPYTFPKKFPINTIHCMRILRAIEEQTPDKLEKATDLFFVRRRSSSFSLRGALIPRDRLAAVVRVACADTLSRRLPSGNRPRARRPTTPSCRPTSP